MWRLLYFIPIWVAFMAFKLVVVVLGLPIVAYMWRHRRTHMDLLLDEKPWLTPWLNPEDWTGGSQYKKANVYESVPLWWIQREGSVKFGMWWHYHAIRNPANGLRNFEWLDLDIIPELVKYKTPQYLRYYEPWFVRDPDKVDPEYAPRAYGYLAWQGFRAGAKWVYHWNDERHFVLKIGWRVEPRDAYEEIDPDGIRHDDAGFASKLLLYRRG